MATFASPEDSQPEDIPQSLQSQLNSFPNRSFPLTAGAYLEARQLLLKGRKDAAKDFKDAMSLKVFIDELEAKVRADASETNYVTLLNAEYTLFHMTATTLLPLNPFLSHWVDNIARWEKEAASSESGGKISAIQKARLYMSKKLLMEVYPPRDLKTLSPRQLLAHIPESPHFSPKDWIKTFPKSSPVFDNPDSLALFKFSISGAYPDLEVMLSRDNKGDTDGAIGANDDPPDLKSPERLTLDELFAAFKAEPEHTATAIAHMPIDDIKCLDLVNKLIELTEENQLLYNFGVDATGMVMNYIQHGLRQIEAMAPEQLGALGGNSARAEEQARAVKLLHLFIRNLLQKDFLTVDMINFELLELGMRYVWVKEIREDPLFSDRGNTLWSS
ncbi:hypothetical protein NA57DRAFT_51993 [Rhizodiscina lignyota]|uniref:CCR4-NOT transcription complex subunit 11 n=1 Tax=Rhizodiscina lignyota TaxID=1504668 RepID=A0A9P4IMC5_9PEZI|nr:hypothetical protein NA57DRAFT_51993 [Rhizodiscina lignyota]